MRTRNTPVAFLARGKFWVNNHAHIVRGNGEANTRFLMYALSATDINPYLTGSTMPKLTQGNMNRITLLTPRLPEQRAITHILGTLDEKIELNRRTNETLEAIAQALFKSWFIDFDPVRAKAGGRDPGFPKPLFDLFPTRLVDSELGEIPEGWEVGCVDDEFDLTMGQSPPGDTYNEAGEGLPFYQGRADVGFRFPTRRVYCTAPTRLAKAGDTLVSVRAPVGDINMAWEDCAVGRGVAAARHKTGSRSYSYQFMRSLDEVFTRFEADGTVFGSIGKNDFHAIPCMVPPRDLVIRFEHSISPIDGRVEVNERESRTLAALRDTLLPKLISGELGGQGRGQVHREGGLMADALTAPFVMHGARDAITGGLAHIEEQVTGIERAVVENPGLAFDLAKTLVESTCRAVLAERSIAFSEDDDLPKLFRTTTSNLPFLPPEASRAAEARQSLARTLNGLHTAIQGICELRNQCGFASHGSGGPRPAMESVQAMLAAEAADTIVGFLNRVHRQDRKPPSSTRVRYDDNLAFNDSVDEAHGMIRIYEVEFPPSEVLFQMEPETYRVYLAEFDAGAESEEAGTAEAAT